jgi:hypothetical protein
MHFCGFSAILVTIAAGNAGESIAKCMGAFSVYLHIAYFVQRFLGQKILNQPVTIAKK